MPNQMKEAQERRPLAAISDGFQKVIITPRAIFSWQDEGGIRYLSLEDFLLNPNALAMPN